MRTSGFWIGWALVAFSAGPATAQVDSVALTARLQGLAVREVRPPRRGVVCVGVSPRSVLGAADPRQMLDPDSALLTELAWMKNLSVSSACELIPDPHRAIYRRVDRRPGVHVAIAAPRVLDANRATVDVQVFWGGLEGETDRCELVQKGGGWHVVACQITGKY